MNSRNAALLAIALAGCALYLPYLSNPAVFDDLVFYSGLRFSEYAASPLGPGLRFPAYFTLASVETLWGRIEAHRVVGLLLHLGCGWALYALQRQLRLPLVAALGGALLFVVHPAAVYAAAYLMQRTIVMAALFSLASLLLFIRGLERGQLRFAVGAALCYSMAVLSKEHAILLPAVALAAVGINPKRFALKYASTYVALCVPAAVLVVLFARAILGTPYEGSFEAVTAELGAQKGAGAGAVEQPWIGSALAQAALFFRYVEAWLVPQMSRMAIDIKIDFAALWAPRVAVPAVAGFLAWGACGLWLLAMRPRLAVAGLGMLYVWVLYLAEFAVIRYQEPFVLYRAYLWAPGLALLIGSLLSWVPARPLPVLVLAAAFFLGLQARDRLETFTSGLALWEDAVAKLPSDAAPGGWRTLYMLGREYLYAGDPQRAVRVVERCIARYPESADCEFGRAAIEMHAERYEPALPHLVRAIGLAPRSGAARHHLGWALENLGCIDEAKAQYRISSKLGFVGGAYRLMRLEKPGSGLLAPRAKKDTVCPEGVRAMRFPPG